MTWNERKGHSQDGNGPGEFGPNYSDRKRYHERGEYVKIGHGARLGLKRGPYKTRTEK